jgi:hypothetical protein
VSDLQGRLFRRGWQVLAVLVAVGVLLTLLGIGRIGGARDVVSTSPAGSGGGSTAAVAIVPASTTTTLVSGTTTSATTTSTTSTSSTSTTLPLFTKQNPLRVLAVGDSLMTYPGYALEDQADVYPGLEVRSMTKQSSGLVRADFYNWPQALGRAVADFRPHLTVILLGTNDSQPVRHQGRSAALFTEAWNAEYAKRIEQFIAIATGSGGSVVWVGLPIMRDRRLSETERRLNELYEVGCVARPGAVYIDGYALFADTTGEYAARLVDSSGATAVMRARDGIHFTMDGADRIAEAVVEVLMRRCRLERAPLPGAGAAAPGD